LAPLVGGQLLLIGDWHIVFVFLAALGGAVFLSAIFQMPESLPRERRSALTFGATFKSWAIVLRDRRFVALALTNGFFFGMICVYIAGAPFALEGGFHLTPTEYTYAFAAVTIIMFSAANLNRILLKRIAAIRLLRYGLSQMAFAGLYLAFINFAHLQGLVSVSVGFALSLSAMGFCGANIMALAMRDYAERAGVAAGLMGFSSSLMGAIAAPLTSVLFGTDVTGVTTFMVILLFTAAVLGLYSLRKEVALGH
jgi:DHA1 family bicyclomycin/chloramphenicol resistance-like MFS transporter